MSVELISILAVGVALAGVILTGIRGLRQDMARLESRLNERISALESRLDGRISALEHQFGDLRERMARMEGLLEGLLEGLREAIAGRAAVR